MFQLRSLLILPMMLSVSCDEKQETEPLEKEGESRSRSTRSERASRERLTPGEALRTDFAKAKSRLSEEERERDLVGVAWDALEKAPEITAQAILELKPGTPEKRSLIEAYLRQLLRDEKTDEAMAWADSLGNESDIQLALSKIKELSSRNHPEQDALQLTETQFMGEVDPAAAQVIQNWADKSPVQAADWVAKLPEGEARSKGFEVLLGAWVIKDASGAFAWISNQGTPKLREEGLAGIVDFLAGQPPPIQNSILDDADKNIRAEIQQTLDQMSPSKEQEDPEKQVAPDVRREKSSSEPTLEDDGGSGEEQVD